MHITFDVTTDRNSDLYECEREIHIFCLESTTPSVYFGILGPKKLAWLVKDQCNRCAGIGSLMAAVAKGRALLEKPAKEERSALTLCIQCVTERSVRQWQPPLVSESRAQSVEKAHTSPPPHVPLRGVICKALVKDGPQGGLGDRGGGGGTRTRRYKIVVPSNCCA